MDKVSLGKSTQPKAMQLPARDLLSRSVCVSSDARLTQPWLLLPVAREGLLEESSPCTGSPPSSPEVASPCSHQNASVARASAQYVAQTPQRCLVHQSVSRHVLSVVRSFSHVALPLIGRAENSTHAAKSDNFAHPTLGTRRSAISNPVQGLESSPWAEMPVRPSRLRPRARQLPKDHMGKLLQQIG